MRMRKRAVPLPLHLLSPVPIDPVVQLPSSDQHLRPYEDDGDEKNTDQRDLQQQITITNTNTSTKESDSGAIVIAGNGVIPSPSTPPTQTKVVESGDGRWCDGDKAMPLKKRRASYEMNGAVVAAGESRMKSTTNKSCPLSSILEHEENDDHDQDDDYDVVDDSDSVSSDDDNENKKKSKSKSKKMSSGGAKKKPSKGSKKGGGIMEGSRCSRVNGRGWRCMQPTLVGYSLCEHHLGKGRLRSMASVRARAKPASINSTTDQVSSPPSLLLSQVSKEKPNEDDGDQKKPISGNNRRRMRIGMVKERSLSSLFGQPNTSVGQLGSSTMHEIK